MRAKLKIITHAFILLMTCFGACARYGYCADTSYKDFFYDPQGKRDPFIPLIGQEKNVMGAGLETVASPDDLKLEGIATGAGGKQAAILNGQIVKEKDKFGSLVIKKISRKSVEISIEGRDYKLSLKEPEKDNAVNKR